MDKYYKWKKAVKEIGLKVKVGKTKQMEGSKGIVAKIDLFVVTQFHMKYVKSGFMAIWSGDGSGYFFQYVEDFFLRRSTNFVTLMTS